MSNIHPSLRAAFTVLFLGTFAASTVCAQTAAPAANTPQAPAKMIGDWTVRCVSAASPSPCAMQEVESQKKTGNRILAVSVALVPAQSRYVMQIALPLGVALASGAKILASSYTSPVMAFRRCDRSGCFVEGLIDSKSIDSLGGSQPAAKIEVATLEGRMIDLPFSLRGFAEARKNMEDLARQKATAVPAAATPAAATP